MNGKLVLFLFCIIAILLGQALLRSSDLSLANSLFVKKPVKAARATSLKEEACRTLLEKKLGIPFPKVRPDFLKNPVTGHALELDGYNAQLRLGFEFNGRQHYQFTPAFHSNKHEFQNGKYRDFLKQDLCKKAGVYLITIPHTVSEQQLEKTIDRELETFFEMCRKRALEK